MSEFEEHAWRRKRELISRAQLIAYDGDLRRGHDEIQALRETWKSVGRAGTDSEGIDQDDSLYSDFKKACDGFYDRRKEARDRAIAAKRTVVYEMGKLAGQPYSRSVGEAARALMTRWKEAERAPKAEEDQMWYELNKYRDQIKEASRRLHEEHKSRQRDFLKDKISNKEAYIADLQAKIYDRQLNWQYRTFNEPSMRNPRYNEIMQNQRDKEWKHNEIMSSMRDRLERANEELRELKRRLDELD